MTSPAFDSALKFVLRWEGGFVDHPNDPGGRTNKGITQKVYDGWRGRQGRAAQDVQLIGDDEVHSIYASDYWVPPRCDLLATPLDLVQFDTAVNMGVGYYEGYSAVGGSVTYLSASGRYNVSGGLSYSGGKSVGRIGVGFQF